MDFITHATLARVITSVSFPIFRDLPLEPFPQQFQSLIKPCNLEYLHRLSTNLLAEEKLIEIIGLHSCLSLIVAHCLKFLEEFDSETAGMHKGIDLNNHF